MTTNIFWTYTRHCRTTLPIARYYFSSSYKHVVSNGEKFKSDKQNETESQIYSTDVFLTRRARWKFSKDYCLAMPKRRNESRKSNLRRIQEGGGAEDNFRGNGSTPKTRERILPLIT